MPYKTETKELEAHTKNIHQVVEHTFSTSKPRGDNRGSGKSSRGGRGGRGGGGGGRGGARSGRTTEPRQSKPLNAPPLVASTGTASPTKRKAEDLADDASTKKAKTESTS